MIFLWHIVNVFLKLFCPAAEDGDCYLSSPPSKGVFMRAKKHINAIRSPDRPASILHNAPAVTRHIHPCAKGIIRRISGNGAIAGEKTPGEQEAKGNAPGINKVRKEKNPRIILAKPGAARRSTCIAGANAGSFRDITIPEIQSPIFGVPSFPAAAFATLAIGGRHHVLLLRLLGAKSHKNGKDEKPQNYSSGPGPPSKSLTSLYLFPCPVCDSNHGLIQLMLILAIFHASPSWIISMGIMTPRNDTRMPR